MASLPWDSSVNFIEKEAAYCSVSNNIVYTIYQEPMSRPKGSKERPTAFDFERFRHLPYMDLSSSGESPFVVAARTVEPVRGDSKSERLRKRKAMTDTCQLDVSKLCKLWDMLFKKVGFH